MSPTLVKLAVLVVVTLIASCDKKSDPMLGERHVGSISFSYDGDSICRFRVKDFDSGKKGALFIHIPTGMVENTGRVGGRPGSFMRQIDFETVRELIIDVENQTVVTRLLHGNIEADTEMRVLKTDLPRKLSKTNLCSLQGKECKFIQVSIDAEVSTEEQFRIQLNERAPDFDGFR